MKISQFSPHIFWSYDKTKELPEEVVIERVLFNTPHISLRRRRTKWLIANS